MKPSAGVGGKSLIIGIVLFTAVLAATTWIWWWSQRGPVSPHESATPPAVTVAAPEPTNQPAAQPPQQAPGGWVSISTNSPTSADGPRAAPGEVHPVDLIPFYNCALSNAIAMGGLRDHPNNLASFPDGTNDFAGIRFSVGGMIQLGSAYPLRCPGITVGAKASRLHLLHGTAGTVGDEIEIATLILHYAGGAEASIPIRYGVHLRDWWRWKKNESPFLGEDTEIVWEGENEFSRSKNCRIRIYKTTLANPSPGRVIEFIDYVRAPTAGSTTPFLLGLSRE